MLDNIGNNIEAVLKQEGEIATCTSGVSMYPMLRNRRDMAIIKSVSGELQKNDVALYRTPNGKLVLHRILQVTPTVYVIRGDNLYKNEHVPKQQVFGVLKGFKRNKKYIDCSNSRGYKLYILYVKLSYPVRYVIFGCIIPFLKKVKGFLNKTLKLK